MKGILSTKLLNQPQRNFLLNAGFKLHEHNFIEAESLDFTLERLDYEYLIITSQNALSSIKKSPYFDVLAKKPVFCVGERTELELKKSKIYPQLRTNYSSELIEVLPKDKSYLFLTSNFHLNLIPNFLTENNIKHEIIEVYKTVFNPIKINNTYDGILFFSPSGVESFLKENTITTEKCICIGKTTAEKLAAVTTNIVLANHPSIENVIIKTIKEFSTKNNE